MADPDISDLKRRMDGALSVLRSEFAGLRTGRASASLLDRVVVPAYDGEMPITQVATANVPEPRLLTVNVWDRSLVSAVEKAVRGSGLGLNPSSDGQIVRVPIPELSEERRLELVKIAGKYSEQARVSVRNVRRDGMDHLKKSEKSGEISEDEHRAWGEEIQEMTDELIKGIDAAFASKEKEILQF